SLSHSGSQEFFSVTPYLRGGCFPQCSTHSGNGLRGDTRNASINSRTAPRRTISVRTNFSNSSHSPPYHSGGISPAKLHTTSSSIFSMRESHGSNDSHPRTLHSARILHATDNPETSTPPR